MKFTAVAIAISSLGCGVAHADDAVAPAPKKEKKICHRIDVTGSIIATRTKCLTAAEWAVVEGQTASINAKGVDDVLNSTRPMGTNPLLK